MKTLVVLCGPPAVGKMTVGLELSRITGLPLFHNHVSIEAILPVFPFGSPEFNRLVGNLRQEVFREVAGSDLPGVIFTLMWGFGLDSDLDFVQGLRSLFESVGGRTVFAELEADQKTRVERNATERRLAAKPSKRDVEASQARLIAADEKWRLNSDGDFPFPDHIKINNENVPAVEVATRIARHFQLPMAPS